jgi:cytochrome oxidase assembly protein ShyY1
MAVGSFRPGWGPAILVFLVLLLTLNLGFWQLRREAEKVRLIEDWQQVMAGAPQPLRAALQALEQQRPVKAEARGRWQAAPLLVWENRRLGERTGVQILQWFETDEGWLLVDRGWAVSPPAPASETAVLHGQLVLPAKPWRAPVLAEAPAAILSFPVLDVPQLRERLARERGPSARILPELLRLAPDSAGALIPMAQQHAVMPERHRAYAVTWFVLSAALALLFLHWSFRKAKSR